MSNATKVITLILIWILLSSSLVEANEPEGSLSGKLQGGDNRRLTNKFSSASLADLNKSVGKEAKAKHKNQDHGDEDKEAAVPNLTYTHLIPGQHIWNAMVLNSKSIFNIRICCRSHFSWV